MKLKDLSKIKSSFKLDGKKYNLNAFTLADRIWVEEEFEKDGRNGLFVSADLLDAGDPVIYLKFAYRLLDNNDFKSFDDFAKKFKNNKDIINTLYSPVCKLIIESNSEVTEDNQDLNKLKKKLVMRMTGFIFMIFSLLVMAIVCKIFWDLL